MNSKQITNLFLLILVIVSAFPEFFSFLFVHETGNIKIIGLMLGLLLAVLIYYKWKYSKHLFYIIFTIVVLFDFFILSRTDNQFLISYILLTIMHIGLLSFFKFSKSIKEHFKVTA